VVLRGQEEEILKGREYGRSKLLRMAMARYVWLEAVLMVQQQVGRDGGDNSSCSHNCALPVGVGSPIILQCVLTLSDTFLERSCLSLNVQHY
jgi:hypothetical protein